MGISEHANDMQMRICIQ